MVCDECTTNDIRQRHMTPGIDSQGPPWAPWGAVSHPLRALRSGHFRTRAGVYGLGVCAPLCQYLVRVSSHTRYWHRSAKIGL